MCVATEVVHAGLRSLEAVLPGLRAREELATVNHVAAFFRINGHVVQRAVLIIENDCGRFARDDDQCVGVEPRAFGDDVERRGRRLFGSLRCQRPDVAPPPLQATTITASNPKAPKSTKRSLMVISAYAAGFLQTTCRLAVAPNLGVFPDMCRSAASIAWAQSN